MEKMHNGNKIAVNTHDYSTELTREDFATSATSQDLKNLNKVLDLLKDAGISKMIDIGCAYGGLTRYVAQYLDVNDVYGVDVDEERLQQARSRGIRTYELDMNSASLSIQDGYFDLVTCFGVLEHLVYFDNFFSESYRVLNKGGAIILAMPNLASYINRMALFFGYQPRDVEISRKTLPGTLPFYPKGFFGHIHSATLRAIKQIMEYYGFTIVTVKPSSPYQVNTLVKLVDKVFSLSPSLSRRFIILGRKR